MDHAKRSKAICKKYFDDYKCEACGDEPAWSFSFDRKGNVRLTGDCTSEKESYYIQFDRFFESPRELVEWFAHLLEKPWYKPDSFRGAIERLSEEGRFHHKLNRGSNA